MQGLECREFVKENDDALPAAFDPGVLRDL
jgi:hypothetical protein